MSPVFGKKRAAGKTVAIIDIESGSLASGLVTISGNEKPKLFGQERNSLAVRGAPTAEVLMREIEQQLEHSLARLSGISSRVGQYKGPEAGIGRIAVFLHAPWITVSMADGQKAKADAHEDTLARLRLASRTLELPVTFHAFATTATPIIRGLFDAPKESLVISIGSEVAELSLLRGSGMVAYATVPAGLNTILRTLEAHAGVSRPEALSILALHRSQREHEWAEAIASGMRQVVEELRQSSGSILSEASGAKQIFVLSREPSTDSFARALTTDESMHELFAEGSTVRALMPRHAAMHLTSHPAKSDMPLLLESLFVDTRFGA